MQSPHSRLAESLAQALPSATADANDVLLGNTGFVATCRVDTPLRLPDSSLASLVFEVAHPELMPISVPFRFRGVRSDSPTMIEDGARYWARTVGQTLIEAVQGGAPDEVATIIGRTHNSYVCAFDRVFGMPESNAERITQKLRAHFGANPWLTSAVINAGALPPSLDQIMAVSVSVLCTATGTDIEVTVNGGRWRPAERIFDDDVSVTRGIVYLSEAAILVPTTAPLDLSLPIVEHTMKGMAVSRLGPESAAGWLGWRAHKGAFRSPASASSIQRVEAEVGRLPEDYRWFVSQVAEGGAGPGYGLRPPQTHEGSIRLADAGCGRFWELRMDRRRRGEVWLHTSSRGSTAGAGDDFVSPDFFSWYSEWLQYSIAQRTPWMQWNIRFCTATTVLRRKIQELHDETGLPVTNLRGQFGPGSLAFTDSDGKVIRPCHGCAALAAQFGLDDSVFELPH